MADEKRDMIAPAITIKTEKLRRFRYFHAGFFASFAYGRFMNAFATVDPASRHVPARRIGVTDEHDHIVLDQHGPDAKRYPAGDLADLIGDTKRKPARAEFGRKTILPVHELAIQALSDNSQTARRDPRIEKAKQTDMTTLIRIGHLSDVHLDGVPTPTVRQLMSKRLIGYLNWRHNRSRSMTRDRLNALIDDLKNHAPDHIAVTGDLTNVALPGEFENARDWLRALGSGESVTAIPGNHDAYVPFADRQYCRLWAPWMSDGFSTDNGPARFPFLRVIGKFALIGLSTAVPTLPLMATGRLGQEQIKKLKKILQDTGSDGFFRIILIHHPPTVYDFRHKLRRLTDAAQFRDAIRQTGTELILHGHNHIAQSATIEGPKTLVPVIGTASASGPQSKGEKAGGYALHEIAGSGDQYILKTIHRGYDESGEIIEKSRLAFEISPS